MKSTSFFLKNVCCATIIAAALAMANSGCRTNKDILNDYEKSLIEGNYSLSVAEVEEKADDGGVDELMWRLHAGSSRYLLNDGPFAIAQFDKAEDIFIKNDQTSTFKQGSTGAFAMISNDRAFPYAGGGEDRIFTCFYKAVDYARKGNLDAMRTELNRAAQHQDNWLWERKKEIAEAAEKLKKDADEYTKDKGGSQKDDIDNSKSSEAASTAFENESLSSLIKDKCDFDAASDGNVETLSRKDWLNKYVQYATGVFRWASGDSDGAAYIKEIAEIDPENTLAKTDFQAASTGAKPTNQVWIFIEDGLGPVREEWRLDLPLVLIPYANRFILYAGMALPYLRYRPEASSSYEVSSGGNSTGLVLLQDVDKLIKTEFDVYFREALIREITRTIVKASVQVALGVVAENASDNYTKIALRGAQIAAAAWAAAVTQADLRCWSALPKKVYAIRVPRPADGTIRITAAGAPVAEAIVPEGNSFVFVRKTSPAAAAVVKTATLPK